MEYISYCDWAFFFGLGSEIEYLPAGERYFSQFWALAKELIKLVRLLSKLNCYDM